MKHFLRDLLKLISEFAWHKKAAKCKIAEMQNQIQTPLEMRIFEGVYLYSIVGGRRSDWGYMSGVGGSELVVISQ